MKKIKLLISFYLLLTAFITSYAINVIDVKKNNLSGNDFLENSNGPQCKGVNDASIFTNLPSEFTFKCEMPYYALYYFNNNFISYSEWAKLISDKYPTSYFYKKIEYNASDVKENNNNDCLILNYNLKLKSNDKNTKGEVTKLQNFLISNGYLVGVNANGNYGPATLKAIKSFQKSNNLIITGVVGKITREKINKVNCNQPQVKSLVSNENIKVSKYKTIEDFLDTREKQGKMVDLYTNLMSEFSCVVGEKDILPLSLVSNLNNILFEKKCDIEPNPFLGDQKYSDGRVSKDSVAKFFISNLKVTEANFFEVLQKEIANIGEFPTFTVKKN